MEQHVIPFNQGIHLTPSAAEDGQLIDCINLIPKDGSLRNAPQLEDTTVVITSGYTLEYVHHPNVSTTNYIISKATTSSGHTTISLYLNPATPNDTPTLILTLSQDVTINQITSLGNTIIVLASDAMHYLLWKDNAYTDLGIHFPEIAMTFGCTYAQKTSTVLSGTFSFTGQWESSTYKYSKINDSDINVASDTIHGAINKLYAEEAIDKGLFAHPFFVRYALRLYDNSTTMPSAPILIESLYDSSNQTYNDFQIAADSESGSCQVDNQMTGHFSAGHKITVTMNTGQLEWELDSNQQDLLHWKDIIRSIDIFVSAPLYLYDQDKKITEVVIEKEGSTQSGYYARIKKVNLPDDTKQRLDDEIIYNDQFYLVHSIKIDELENSQSGTPDLKKKLEALVSRERLKDDYDSHDNLMPLYAFPYNSRLNIANISKEIFSGFTPLQLNLKSPTGNMAFAVTYSINGQTIVTRQDGSNVTMPARFYYYNPNADAIKLDVVREVSVGGTTTVSYNSFSLFRHNSLQGTYAIIENSEWNTYNGSFVDACGDRNILPAATSRLISLPNKIYQSEVNNPFFFPLSGINTVGVGEINGICAAVKALSQGQFGQFPLYVFSSDGIWTLQLKDDGTYSNVTPPITRDVCINPKSIIQTDTAVLYATERGLHLLQGSETRLLTSALEAYSEAFSTGITIPSDFSDITPSVLAIPTPLLQQLAIARLSYDGINHIIHVYPPLVQENGSPVTPTPVTHFVLNLDSMEWARTTQPIPVAFIDSFPNSALQVNETTTENNVTTTTSKLYQYALPTFDNSPLHQGFILTRETALGAPLTYKLIHDLRTLKHYHSSATSTPLHKVRIIPLYSNDRLTWYRLTSLKAKSAIWYRFAIFTNMADADILEALALITTPRRTNKLR